MSRNAQGIILRILTLLIWAIAIYLLIYSSSWYLLAAILLLHVAEIPLKGYKMGIQAGHTGAYSIIMTLVFGFTWWLYLSE